MCVHPGAYPTLELHVRLFFRRVFLSQCTGGSDKAFWLSLILKPFPMVHQARVLFLLFGPMCGGEYCLLWIIQNMRTFS